MRRHNSETGQTNVPSAGRLGWFWGSDRWAEGEFFRYRITELQPAAPAGPAGCGPGREWW